jgi:hypothetical protein
MHTEIFVGKPETRRSLVRIGCTWKDNVKMDHREIGLKVVYCIRVIPDKEKRQALLNTEMNLRVP